MKERTFDDSAITRAVQDRAGVGRERVDRIGYWVLAGLVPILAGTLAIGMA